MLAYAAMSDEGRLFAMLDRLTELGEAKWPACCFERATFQQRLLSLIDVGSSDPEDALSQLHVPDLYLATACVLRLPRAQEILATHYLSGVPEQVARLGAAAAPLGDDVRRELEDSLLFGREGIHEEGGVPVGAPPRIAQYAGRGTLEAFVARAARNLALTMLRPRARDHVVPLEESESRGDLPRATPPALTSARHDEALRGAVRVALAALDRRQRTIVRLHLVEGVTLTQIARMLRVHQSTVSRAFDAALHALYANIRNDLELRFRLNESEMQSIVRDARSRIDLSLSRLLRDTAVGG
jgi:RNA polymerase sigma-70 factor (ECF subfamily)